MEHVGFFQDVDLCERELHVYKFNDMYGSGFVTNA